MFKIKGKSVSQLYSKLSSMDDTRRTDARVKHVKGALRKRIVRNKKI